MSNKVIENGHMKNEIDFKIDKDELIKIVDWSRARKKNCDEVEFIEKNNGKNWLIDGLKTNIQDGIDENSIEERTIIFGSNKKKEIPLLGFWKLLWEALRDLLLRILIVCGIIIWVINYTVHHVNYATDWIDGIAIFIAVALSSGVTAFNDYKKELKFKELKDRAEKDKFVYCMREGKKKEIQYDDVNVGDIILVENGMELPADGILIEGIDVKCDESAMTGETKPLKKEGYEFCLEKNEELIKKGQSNTSDRNLIPSPVLISGTKVVDGRGLMIILAVGESSQIGKINKSVEENDELTPLQLKLDKIAKDIGYFGLVSGIFVFLIVLIRSSIEFSLGTGNVNTAGELTYQILNALVIGITVLVVAIPEGLPLAVTISLAYSVKKMMLDNNLVRKLQACETMGGANIICSDKTGTLTKNEMYLTNFWNFKENIIYESESSKAINYKSFTNDETGKKFYESIIFNSNDDPNVKKGNPTEWAILKYFHLLEKNIIEDRNKVKVIYKGGFNSDRKRMSTIVEIDGKLFSLMKGASELMIKECKNILNLENGELKDLDNDFKMEIDKAIDNMASKSLRTIGIIMKELDSKPNFEDKDESGIYKYEKENYTLIGICGIKDIIRPEVPASIKTCNSAGIQVKMVTGDNKITARAIAQEVGIIKPDDFNPLVLEGPEFIDMVGGLICENCVTKTECDCVNNKQDLQEEANKKKKIKKLGIKNKDKFKEISKRLKVLARSRPDDKLTWVVGLKELGYVIAVTGDGTNDAPALKKADVGFAMNIAGTQVAKDAADILLLDDNFKSIVEAVKWGRNIYDNIRKFLQFQLTVNIVAVIVTILSSAIDNVPIFRPVQMLWLNIIMDTFASLALATEPPTVKLLDRQPHNKNEYIINKKMTKHIVGQVIYQMTIVLVFLYAGPYFLPASGDRPTRGNTIFVARGGELIYPSNIGVQYNNPSEHFTYNFNTFVILQVFNFINARKLNDEINTFKGILNSYLFLLMVGIIIFLQVIFVTFFGVGVGVIQWGLNYYQWFICIGFGAFGLVVNIFLKLIPEEKLCFQIGKKTPRQRDLRKKSTLSIKRIDHEDRIRNIS